MDSFWAGEHQKFSFDLQTKVKEYQTLYYMEIKAEPDFTHHSEQLSVNGVNVISIQDGKGIIRNENGENETKHSSNRLALMSTEDDGNKPITQALLEFIKNWEFYTFDPSFIRQESVMRFSTAEKKIRDFPKLDKWGSNLVEVLWGLYNNSSESFRNVSEYLRASTNREIGYRQERLQQPNSLINQIKQVVNDHRFAGKVFLVEAVRELEAWLLIDCIGIFCYYATKRAQFRENCRSKVLADPSLKRLVNRYQKGDTETIVEPVSDGKGVKEYLIEFSERVLKQLNSNLTSRNIDREKYHETRSPEVAEHIELNRETLRRNKSLKKLGDVIAQVQ